MTAGVRRTHHAANLMSATPKNSWGSVKALLHSIYDHPDTEAGHSQFERANAINTTSETTTDIPTLKTITA